MPVGLVLLAGLAAAPTDADLRVRAAEPWPARLERLTRPWRGAPYVRSPLGEGVAPDADPRMRFDAFDCTTFVETALAAASVRTPGELLGALDGIRYDGAVAFARRRHLVLSQWLPPLVEAGLLEPITARVGGPSTRRIRFRLGPERWARRRIAAALELPADRVPRGPFPVDVIPLAHAIERARATPPGTLMNLVRVNWPLSPILVTHQGLVLRDPVTGGLILRHASPTRGRVLDEPLEAALHRWAKAKRKWPIAGVSLYATNPPAEHRAP